jgi:NAD(P)-dependent dehydrogenase (short-subunit alcohol dehydrogenase family)
VLVSGHAGQQERGEEVVARIRESGGTAAFVAADVRHEEDVERAVEVCVERFGGVDAVVTSAGVGAHPAQSYEASGLLALELDHWSYVLDVNLTGTYLAARCAALRMVTEGRGGTIVTIGSVASKKPSGGTYAISKAAVWMLTRALADELAPSGVRVNCLAPGYTQTKLLATRARAADSEDAERWLQARAAGVPLGRLGTVEDVASAAVFLSCDESAYVTGSILHVDGGYVSAHAGG